MSVGEGIGFFKGHEMMARHSSVDISSDWT